MNAMTSSSATHSCACARIFTWAPDIGTQVLFQDEQWEVSGWLKVSSAKETLEEDTGYGVLMHIDHEDCELQAADRLVFCKREEASYLSLRGVGGVVAAVRDCRVLGPCSSGEKRQELKRIANGLIGVEIF